MAFLRRLLRSCWMSQAHGGCVDEELQTTIVAAEELAERRRSLRNSTQSRPQLACVPSPSCQANIPSNPHPRPLPRTDARPPSSPFAASHGAAQSLRLVRRDGSSPWQKIAAFAALASASTRADSRAKNIVVWHTACGTAHISRDGFSADSLLVVGDISGGCSRDGRDGSNDGDERTGGALLADVPPALLAGLLKTYGGIDSAVAALKRADSSPQGHLLKSATGMTLTGPASRQGAADPNSEPLARCRQLAEQAPRDRGPVSGPTSLAQARQLFSDRLMSRFELLQRESLQQVVRHQTYVAMSPLPLAAVKAGVCRTAAGTGTAVNFSAAAAARANQPDNECSFSHTNFEHMRNGPLITSCSERLSGSQAMARMQKVVDFYSGGGYNLMEGVVERVRARNVNELDLARGEMEAVLRRMHIGSDCQVVRHMS